MKLQSYLSRLIWIAIAPLLVLATVFAVVNVREFQADSARDAQDLARNVAGTIDRQIGFRTAAMRLLAADARLADPAAQAQVYRDAQNFARIFSTPLLFAEPGGRMVWNTRAPLGTALPPLPTPKGRSAAALALASHEPAVGDLVFGPVAQERLLAIAVPVVRDGQTVGLLLATLEARLLEERLHSLALPSTWRVSLRDSTNELIGAAGAPAPDAGSAERVAVRLSNAPWTVAVTAPSLLASRDARGTAAMLALLLLTATVAAVLGGKFAARKLARDLATLADPHAAPTPPGGGDIAEVRRIGEHLAALERARGESEAKLAATFEQAAVGIAHIDPDGRCLRVNPALAALLGYAPGELVGRLAESLTHPDDRAAEAGDIARALAGLADAYAADRRYVARGGRVVWAHVRVALVRAAGGRPEYFIAVVEDITARKRAEDALRSTTSTLQATLASMNDALAMFDGEARLTHANDAFLRMHGFAGSAEAGQALAAEHDLLEVRTIDGVPIGPGERPMRRALRGEAVAGSELRVVRRDTQRTWVASYSAAPVRDDAGFITGAVVTAQDVTARRAALDALRASEERLRLLVEHAPASIAIFDRNMRYLAVSQRWRDDYALGERDLVGHSHYEIFPEIGEAWRAVHRRALAGEIVRTDEDAFVRADGATQWLRWEVRPWRTDNRDVGGIVIFTEDITARRVAQRALRESDARYRELFEANPHPMWVFDPATLRFLAVNDAAITQYGYTRDEFLAMTIADIRPPEDVPRVQAAVAGHVDAAAPTLWRHRRKDGTLIRVEITSHRLQFDTRNAVVVLATDVTARLEAEAQLRKLSMAIEQSPDAVVITDLAWNVEYVNEAFVAATGYAREEVLGRSARLLGSPVTNAAVEADVAQALASGQAWKGEFVNRRKDGTDYVASAVVAPIREADGTVTHYVAVQEDITEKKRLAEELDHHRHHLADLVDLRTHELSVATRAATAANAAKSAFLTNMSHEIRTPMNAVLGFAYLLKRSGVTAQQQDWIDKLTTAGEHLLLLINDILDLSKIESGKLVLENVDFPLQTIVDNVRSLVFEHARRKGLAITVDCDDVPLWLRGDPTRLRQALLNYAGNAVKFTESGRIEMRARLVREDAGRLLVRFEVSDTGAGVPEANLATLFEAFRQGDDSTTRKHGGTGLGLAITRRLAEAMGGEAGATSRVGAGSTFWFTAWLARGQVPRGMVNARDGDPEADLRARHAGTRVLLVEDDPINQEVAVILLSDAGLAVDVAHDGQEALAMVSDEHRLILMDLQMPRLDGIEATRAIRARPGHGRVPILAMTANAFDEDRRRCLDAGMNDFLAKPFDPADLYATVRRWLDAG